MDGVSGRGLPAQALGAGAHLRGDGGVRGEVEPHQEKPQVPVVRAASLSVPAAAVFPLLCPPAWARAKDGKQEEDMPCWFRQRCVPRSSTWQPGACHVGSPPGKGLLAVDILLKPMRFRKLRDVQPSPVLPEWVPHRFHWVVPLRCRLVAPLPSPVAPPSACCWSTWQPGPQGASEFVNK